MKKNILYVNEKVKMLVAQSRPTLWDTTDCSPPGSSVHGILQTTILEWVAIPFSRGSSQPRDQTQVSHIAGRFFTSEPPGTPLYVNTFVHFVYGLPYWGKGIQTCSEFKSQGKSEIVQVSSQNPEGTMASKMKMPSGSRCEVIANSSLVLVES